jgi:hypothetical protein
LTATIAGELLEGAGPRDRHRVDLMRAATRSSLLDLARLDRRDLAVAIHRRGRPRRWCPSA